jgi:hypothetical protein
MKKFLAISAVIVVMAISSISARNVNFVLEAYVAESVVFEVTTDGYRVNSNTPNVDYGFYDLDSNITDAYNAKIFTVVSV